MVQKNNTFPVTGVSSGPAPEPANRQKTSDSGHKAAKKLFWGSTLFYALVAFEFFYMFSPFAVYFYGVYNPGLNFLSLSGSTSWLTSFFMPHIVRETSSSLLNLHEPAGFLLLVGGMTGFAIGAFQVYRNKLLKRQNAVSGGIYRFIRHPQYLALMVASLGMVLIWPRYLVLFGFVTVCFAYYLLSRAEEKICLGKFPDYADYLRGTGMFFPRKVEKVFTFSRIPSSRFMKFLVTAGIYILALLFAFIGARSIHQFSIRQLYSYSTGQEVYVSIGKLQDEELKLLISTAGNCEDVSSLLNGVRQTDRNARFINYVMPLELYISEVPMHIPEGVRPGHGSPRNKDQSYYKIIYTKAVSVREQAMGEEILKNAINKIPVAEVWINRLSNEVIKVMGPPDHVYYEGIPVPVF